MPYHPVPNPFALEGNIYQNVIEALLFPGFALLFVSLAYAAASILTRRDKGSRVERQQIKWLGYAFALMIVGLVLPFLGVAFWAVILAVAAFNSFPLAVGIAVLRYRLFDIDVIINRTLVYGGLTATLGLAYFGGVTVSEMIFRAFTGGEEQQQLAIVISTLIIAALFTPLRRRIQSFIDKRFYRSKYDARKTLEAFSAKLRNETDLNALSGDLVGVVRETMQPAHVSLWLHPDPALKDKKKRAVILESGHRH